MGRFILRRCLAAIPVLFGALLLSFLVLNVLPGDPTQGWLEGRSLSPAQQARIRAQLDLGQPIWIRFAHYLGHLLTGHFGRSIRIDEPVLDRVGAQLPATIELAAAATIVAVALGVLGGLLAGVVRRPVLDRLMSMAWLTGLSVPTFWLGLLLITFVSFRLRALPAVGSDSITALVLPAATLALAPAALIAQLLRDGLHDALAQPYAVAARAKGLTERSVVLRHALRNAVLPVITVGGLTLGGLVTSAVVVEDVFARQGIGRLLVESILDRDIPVVQAIVLIIAAGYLLINLLVDVLYAVVDPRVRTSLMAGSGG